MRRLVIAAARVARVESGFAMLEVLAATVVLAVGIGATFELLVTATHATSTDRIRQAETSVARELVEDTRALDYNQLTPSSITSAIQPLITGSTASGSTLTVTRAIYKFSAAFTSCSLDDPADSYGDHSSPPASGGSWCPDVAPSGTTDSSPDDYKRISIVVSPTGDGRTTPTVQQTFLIYNKAAHPPAVSCLSVNTTCPGTNQSYSTGTQLTFNVTTTVQAASVEWLVNGSLPSSSQLPSGATDPYTPSSTASSFTWVLPSVDGTYTISALGYDTNGNAGTKTSLQITVNLHQAIPPASVTAGWNNQLNGVDIQWLPSVDQDILYYNVYSQVGTSTPTLVCSAVKGTSCYDLTAPSPLPEPSTCQSPPQSFTTSNHYWVVGVDSNPATGQPRQSTSTSPAVDANLCDHPPSAPTNLTGTLSNGQLQLSWTAPSPADPDAGDSIAYWRIYRFTGSSPNVPGDRYDLIGALDSSGNQVTSYTDQSPDPGGAQQNYCVTSVDTHLNESPCSNAVTG
jgi:hypothetical protein